jgi:serine protease
MNKLYASLLLVVFAVSISATASDKNSSNNSVPLKSDSYNAGVLVLNVKSIYRSICSSDKIQNTKIQDAFSKISAYEIKKKFPRALVPERKTNKFGKKLVDLTLIYEVHFSPVVRMEEAINLIQSSDIVEYAEPLYKQYMDFTPNDPSVGSQYHINKISAYAAWDHWTGDTNVVIGIVDSGTDWDHPDLQANIKYNYADPIDGIDNDNDGFIDNFRGWDVSENDNDPMCVASSHGSHVSGCADAVTNNATGVAGPAYNCKFLPVKSTHDASASTIDNGYDGIVYAADHGCAVINCSWGRTGFESAFEQSVIDYAMNNKDVLVVAASGNDGLDETHYPSAYSNVTSVSSTTALDGKSSFSNYNKSVDVCAPGSNILATIINDTYASLDGTSMASPIAAGCAGMIKSKFPSLNAYQVGEQLRSSCDYIYNLGGNTPFIGKLGKGRVNLFKAVTDSVSPGVALKSYKADDNNDNVFIPGDTLSIQCLFENLLRPTTNLVCSLSTTSGFVQILQNNFNPGVVGTFDTVSNYVTPYRVLIKPTAPLNTEITFRVYLTDGTWSDIFVFTIIVNVDYINVAINQVATSISSKGLIGYNQTGQTQGLGFTYQNGPTILYDMGLMIGAAGTQVSDMVRNATGNDADFTPYINVTALEPGVISDFDVNGVFKDNGVTSTAPLNLIVNHHAFAWVDAPNDKYVMVQYYIKNNSASPLNSLYAGIFSDWDIPAYGNNKCSTDLTRRLGYVWSTDAAGLYGGVKLLSHTAGFNHNAIDNTAANGGIDIVTGGFTDAEKYQAMSTSRSNSGTASATGNDVLSCVASGPFNVAAGDSVEVTFALLAGESLQDILASADAAQLKYDSIFVGILPVGRANADQLFQSYPNPAGKETRIEFGIDNNNFTNLSIYNMMGEKVKTIVDEKLSTGRYSIMVDVSTLPSGNYMYKIISGNFTKTLPLTVVR